PCAECTPPSPDLTTDGRSPVHFLRFVVLGDAAHELAEVMPASYAANGCHDQRALADHHVHCVPHFDRGLAEQVLAQPKPLTVTPFLHLGDHRTPLPWLSEV